MKKKLIVLIIMAVIITTLIINVLPSEKNEEYLRIHIRANSNEEIDQNIKYRVRDEIIEYLTPILSETNEYEDALRRVGEELSNLSKIADKVLQNNGFGYLSKAKLSVEKFPARKYNDLVLEEGLYEALIIELGKGEGDNWWCVAFPPLCFVPNKGKNVKYKSKIMELIEKNKCRRSQALFVCYPAL